MKNEKVKENIVEITTKLIEQYNGDTKKVTARLIAEKTGIGLGSINYYFGSKENLITECVQRIIGKVIADVKMKKEYSTDKERLTAWAVYVFDFLFEYSSISRISILGDLQNYTLDCNSVRTQYGFMNSVTDGVSDRDKSMLVFILTAAMQSAFLGRETVKQLLGYDFEKSEDRAAYIKRLTDILFEGTKQNNGNLNGEMNNEKYSFR